MDEDLNEPYFTTCLSTSTSYPTGFLDWEGQKTQEKYRIIFADGTRVDARIFMDLQQRFDCGAYTEYATTKYNEL